MDITVVGLSYVGTVVAANLAAGHRALVELARPHLPPTAQLTANALEAANQVRAVVLITE